jgi:hypothetical protein
MLQEEVRDPLGVSSGQVHRHRKRHPGAHEYRAQAMLFEPPSAVFVAHANVEKIGDQDGRI